MFFSQSIGIPACFFRGVFSGELVRRKSEENKPSDLDAKGQRCTMSSPQRGKSKKKKKKEICSVSERLKSASLQKL